jgi:hypothetical protein
MMVSTFIALCLIELAFACTSRMSGDVKLAVPRRINNSTTYDKEQILRLIKIMISSQAKKYLSF